MIGRQSVVPLLAKRFLLSKVSDRFLSFIAWVSVVGVALGVLALTVVTSVINGFEGELVRVITGMNGDVVFYSRGEPVSNIQQIEGKIREVLPSAEAITPSFVTELMVSGPEGTAGSVLEGIDMSSIGKVTAVPNRVTAGRLPIYENEIAIGSALAERIGAKVDSEVRVIAPFIGDEGSPSSKQFDTTASPRAVTTKVVGIVQMGMYEYDSKFVFASLGMVQRFLEQPNRVNTFKIRLKKGSDSRQAADRLLDSFGYPFRAKDWAQLNKNLFYAIKLEKAVIAIILTVIVIVAAFNVVSTLMMMIHDKTKEIAILKAMGLRSGQSFRLFCLIGMGIGIVGTGAGAALGLMVNTILSRTRLIELPSEIYYIGFLPVVVHWEEIGLIAFVALLITFAASVLPAYQVSNRRPLEGLRYD